MFSLENINLVYDIGKEVQTYALKNINLKIDKNRLIGIMGPSGSGKSSLLYLMAGLKEPSSGTVTYNEKIMANLSKADKAKLRLKEFGFVFQKHYLVDYLTVIENVLVPINSDKTSDKARAMQLLEELGISHLANKKPHQLSGGQRQRVSIARALINDPKVVFADEPTAALDHENAAEVMKFLSSYKNKALIIVVTHDPAILEEADEVINIRDGKIKNVESLRGEVI